jgi:hypothetical protein
VRTAQRRDSYCNQLLGKVQNGAEHGCLISNDDLLYVGQDWEHARLIVPKELTQAIIHAHHDKIYAGHQGVKRTYDLVKINYFWPHMSRDIENYVKQCESCAKLKAGRQPTAPLGELPETTFPFELVSFDICGPYVETKRGNRYLLTYVY